jgi:integrase
VLIEAFEAERARRALLRPAEGLTAWDVVRRWVEHAPHLAESTRRAYLGLARARLLEPLSALPAACSEQDLRRVLATIRDGPNGLSAQSLAILTTILHRAFAQAVADGLLPTNPAAAIRLPRVKRRPARFLTAEQAQALLQAAEGADLQTRVLVHLALTTGLRIGELLALRWEDIDLQAAELRVSGTLDKKTRARTAPKTPTALRRVELGPAAVALLTALKAEREAFRDYLRQNEAEELVPDTGYVFVNSLGRPIQYDVWRDRTWAKLLKRAGLPYAPPHALRHTHATLLLSGGESLNVVATRLGHADPGVTVRVYGHTLPGLGRRAAERAEAALRPAQPQVEPRLARPATAEEMEGLGLQPRNQPQEAR